ncbi:hypothetical protein PI125_g13679 [Phytophthora idaei]|nr:hypothetical protein PI125_g13679 [Phytophthora idaei]
MPDIDQVGKIAAKYPVCYNQKFMQKRSPTVLQKRRDAVINNANFGISWRLVERVNHALHTWGERQPDSHCESVDPDPNDVIPAAYIASEMSGFSGYTLHWSLC